MIGRLHVNAAGFAAPGLDDAAALRAHLAGAPLGPVAGWKALPACLSRRQALRLSDATRLAIMATAQIGAAVPADGGWVFASSTGEGGALHEILMALRADEIMIPPFRFQNAVHNAAQGQWSIVAGATGPMTSIAAHDDTAGAGLLKAAMHLGIERTALGLVVFDAPMPEPLHEKRPFALPMAAALALSPEAGPDSVATIELDLVPGQPPTPPPVLGDSGNPAAAMLALLEQVFAPGGAPVILGLPGSSALRATVRGPFDAQ